MITVSNKFPELIESKKLNKDILGAEFVEGIRKGREDLAPHYLNMFYLFGDIFCVEKKMMKSDFILSIQNGANVSDLITQNMEALMMTILEIGCGKDWPEYLEGDDYQMWLMERGTKENAHGNLKKPVSLSCDMNDN